MDEQRALVLRSLLNRLSTGELMQRGWLLACSCLLTVAELRCTFLSLHSDQVLDTLLVLARRDKLKFLMLFLMLLMR